MEANECGAAGADRVDRGCDADAAGIHRGSGPVAGGAGSFGGGSGGASGDVPQERDAGAMGLRDGRWKFIQEIRTGKAELYDGASDPGERNNVAAERADQVERYAAMCEDWFLRADAEYTARLENYQPPVGRTIRPDEYRTPGPKAQSTGVLNRDGWFTW